MNARRRDFRSHDVTGPHPEPDTGWSREALTRCERSFVVRKDQPNREIPGLATSTSMLVVRKHPDRNLLMSAVSSRLLWNAPPGGVIAWSRSTGSSA